MYIQPVKGNKPFPAQVAFGHNGNPNKTVGILHATEDQLFETARASPTKTWGLWPLYLGEHHFAGIPSRASS